MLNYLEDFGQHAIGLFKLTGFGFVYLHLSASMSFPGVSKHFRISCVCCLTVIRESSSSLAWSSMAGGEAIAL